MQNLKLDPTRHQIWADNMAHHLDGMSPELADKVVSNLNEVARPDFDPNDMPDWGRLDFDAQRPLQKSLRDLHQPYTDQQVSERLEHVTRETLELVERMKVPPSRLFVIGSLNKGRFGGHSDVDLLCLNDKPLEFEGAFVANHRCDDTVQVLRTNEKLLPKALGFAGAHIEVKTETLRDTLRNTWQSSLHKVNMAVEETPDGQVLVTRSGPRVAGPEPAWDVRCETGLLQAAKD